MSKATVVKKWRFKQAAVGIHCAICHEYISPGGDKGKGGLTVDHIIPKALGGTDRKDNLQPAHEICNRHRGTMLVSEFQDKSSNEAILRRALEIIEAAEPRIRLSQRLMSVLKQLGRGKNASGA